MKRHQFFKTDSWTWDNIRQQEPPVVPELKGDMDTQYFDVIDDEKDKADSFATPRVCLTSLPPSLFPFCLSLYLSVYNFVCLFVSVCLSHTPASSRIYAWALSPGLSIVLSAGSVFV